MSEISAEQEQLVELVKNRSDQEINDAVAAVGVDNMLDLIFDAMRQRFNPEAAAGQSATVQWDVAAPERTHHRYVSVAEGGCSVGRGEPESPRVTLGLSLPDFMRFISGELDGMNAVMSGKLSLKGDMMFAQSMQAWFI